MKKNIFNRFNFSSSYKKEIIDFIKSLSNVEIGGNRLYDGSNNHYMQNPNEIVDLIFELKKYEKSKKIKLKNFLEIGFATGINNTILNKFFKFNQIVAVDIIDPGGTNTNNFYANLRFKNLSLICGNSTDKRTVDNVRSLGKFDLIFIDGGHDYSTVKKDFKNYKNLISSSGIIVLHDIKSNLDIGVPKFWKEVKSHYKNKYIFKELFYPGHLMECGIGLIIKK
jgi:predicted O-methyltransferase YrrM